MRHNAANVVEAAGEETIADDAGLPVERVQTLLAQMTADLERLPRTPDERAFDQALVRAAVHGEIEIDECVGGTFGNAFQ